MQQGIKKLQWFEYFKVVFLEILNAGLCRVFANQVTYICVYMCVMYNTYFHEEQIVTNTAGFSMIQ